MEDILARSGWGILHLSILPELGGPELDSAPEARPQQCRVQGDDGSLVPQPAPFPVPILPPVPHSPPAPARRPHRPLPPSARGRARAGVRGRLRRRRERGLGRRPDTSPVVPLAALHRPALAKPACFVPKQSKLCIRHVSVPWEPREVWWRRTSTWPSKASAERPEPPRCSWKGSVFAASEKCSSVFVAPQAPGIGGLGICAN